MQAAIRSPKPWHDGGYPTRHIAGVPVIDTPLVRSAHDFARQHSNEMVYKHVMRSWLFGAAIISNNSTLNKTIDVEAHAVATLLHDVGWDQTPGSPVISSDKRFEVDGAIAARDFINEHNQDGKWNEHRIQLVWDAIALHTQQSLFDYKEPLVKITGKGIQVDFVGVLPGLSQKAYDSIIAEFPHDDFVEGISGALVWLCETKPSTTYGLLDSPLSFDLVG